MYGGKFAFQNRLGKPFSWKEIYRFSLFYTVLILRAISKYKPPKGAYIWRGDLRGVFWVTSLGGLYLEGLIHGGAYFRNFTVPLLHTLFRWANMTLIEHRSNYANVRKRNKKRTKAH